MFTHINEIFFSKDEQNQVMITNAQIALVSTIKLITNQIKELMYTRSMRKMN